MITAKQHFGKYGGVSYTITITKDGVSESCTSLEHDPDWGEMIKEANKKFIKKQLSMQ